MWTRSRNNKILTLAQYCAADITYINSHFFNDCCVPGSLLCTGYTIVNDRVLNSRSLEINGLSNPYYVSAFTNNRCNLHNHPYLIFFLQYYLFSFLHTAIAINLKHKFDPSLLLKMHSFLFWKCPLSMYFTCSASIHITFNIECLFTIVKSLSLHTPCHINLSFVRCLSSMLSFIIVFIVLSQNNWLRF